MMKKLVIGEGNVINYENANLNNFIVAQRDDHIYLLKQLRCADKWAWIDIMSSAATSGESDFTYKTSHHAIKTLIEKSFSLFEFETLREMINFLL